VQPSRQQGGEEFKRATAVGPGAVAPKQCGASAESVSASMPEYTQKRVRVAAAASKTNACVGCGERERCHLVPSVRLDTAGNSPMHT